MAEVAEKSIVARSPDEVWATLAQYDAISRWASNVDHSCLTTEQGEGVGAVRRVQVGRNVLLERVVEWEAGERLSYAIEGLPSVVRSVTNTWQLDATDGATAVTLTTRVDAGPRPPQLLIARVLGRVLARASREMLAGLKNHLEEDVT